MRRIIPLALLALLAFACMSLPDRIKPESSEMPNVILIFTDDQGYRDLGVFGAPDIETPYLDKLAREGVRLTSYYTAQAICSASRAAILTGCYPNRLGIHNALSPDSPIGLNTDETTLAEMLRNKGYATAIFGKWHLGDQPQFMPTRQGFDEYFGIPYSNDMWPFHPEQGSIFNFGPLPLYEQETIIDTLTDQASLTTQITERSVSFINRHKDAPFFLYVPHPQPHVPLFASDKFKGKSKAGLYGDVIMEIDWSVGQILKALKANGIYRKTIVIYTSDNGPWLAYCNHAGSALPFREGKGTAWEGGHREPFIISYPEKLDGGRVLEEPVMSIDILPTIAELTGSPLPEKPIDGISAWDYLSGKSGESPQKAYFFYCKVNELQGVRYGPWKLYFPHQYRTMTGQVPGKDGLPGKYRYVDLGKIALFNVREDPGEEHDVAAEHPEVVAEIQAMAGAMRSRLGDALTGASGTELRDPGRVTQQN
jgi:arylsulfatase